MDEFAVYCFHTQQCNSYTVTVLDRVIITLFSVETAMETAIQMIEQAKKKRNPPMKRPGFYGWVGGNITATYAHKNAANARHSNENPWGLGRFDKPAGPGVGLSRAELWPVGQKRPASALIQVD